MVKSSIKLTAVVTAMKWGTVMRLLAVLVIGTSLSMSALAHNVLGGVYAIGSTIEGEAGFSNGDMAKAGTPVLIQAKDGRKLGETTTDEEGFFVFEAREQIDHHFIIDMSAGHVLNLVLPADELPKEFASSHKRTAAQAVVGNATDKAVSTVSSLKNVSQDELQKMIEQAVARQVKPLRQELAAYKEKAGFQDILGGIGYIFGLCGLGIWWQQRKQAKQINSPKHQDSDRVRDHA